MDSTLAYLRSLRQRGYTMVTGGSHVKVYWGATWVATASVSTHSGRGLKNLKAAVRRFEKGLSPGRGVTAV